MWKVTKMAEPKAVNAELFYNTRPVFFSHNSIDQIHPLVLDQYFTWNKLPKVALNWINQTEATINLSIENITQFKLTNWFSFGAVYFNVMAYKMISQTNGTKVYQYHLKMNIHNTFLPTIFNYIMTDTNNALSYPVLIRRTNYITANIRGGESGLKKLDPMLDFKNKNYALISSCIDYSNQGGFYTNQRITDLVQTKEMPNKSFATDNSYLYFIYQNDDNSTGGINYFKERRYKTIKWYVWKNPRSYSYILIPSIADARCRLTATVIRQNRTINNVINIATGKWNDPSILEGVNRKTFECSNNDDEIEHFLLNNTTANTEFANQDNFVGAFFGPTITGGQWNLFKPLGSSAPAFACVVTNNNIDIFNTINANTADERAVVNCANYKSTKIYTSLPITTSGNITINNSVSRNLIDSDQNAAWSSWILTNISIGENAYKVLEPFTIDNSDFKLINLTNIQIGNNITGTNPYYRTPYGTYSYNYPQSCIVITNAYQQYLNSVKNSQDTSMAIAKQNMIVNTSQHIANGVIGSARGIATAATNWFNPSKIATGSLDAAQAISDATFGVTREILGYENKQKEIDATNLDKQNSIGATMYSSTVTDNIQNLYYGRGVGIFEYNVFGPNQTDKTTCKLPLIYWTSVLGKIPTTWLELNAYSNYLFWYGIYLEEKYPLRNINGALFYEDIVNHTAGFWYIDMEMPTYLIDDIFGNLNMGYKLMIQTIFDNGMRLYFNGATPMKLLKNKTSYQPFVSGV